MKWNSHNDSNTAEKIKQWVSQNKFTTALTLTHPNSINELDMIDNIYGEFMKRLNWRVLRRRYSIKNEKLHNIAIYESTTDANNGKQRWHIHACLTKPDYVTRAEFANYINTIWLDLTKPKKSIIYTDIQDIYSDGWLDYCLKFINNSQSSPRVSSHASLYTATV